MAKRKELCSLLTKFYVMRGNLLTSEAGGGNLNAKKELVSAVDSQKLEHNLLLLQVFVNSHFHNTI